MDQTRHVKALDQMADLLTENARLTASLRQAEADLIAARHWEVEYRMAEEKIREARNEWESARERAECAHELYTTERAARIQAEAERDEARWEQESATESMNHLAETLATERAARESAEQLAVWIAIEGITCDADTGCTLDELYLGLKRAKGVGGDGI